MIKNSNHFKNIDLNSFWKESKYADKEYTEAYPDEAMIASIEEELGYLNYKLPKSYIALMQQTRNGGTPVNTCFPTTEATSWAEDHIAITGIFGIGRKKNYSLGGSLGSQFRIDEWGYPPIGIAICDCPSAGHDMIFLDYRRNGSQGEPEVVHIDQEDDYKITWLAPNFEAFIEGLVHEDVFDTFDENMEVDFKNVHKEPFSSLLIKLCINIEAKFSAINNIEQRIRKLAEIIIEDKGHFYLHADENSLLMYNLQFWLYTQFKPETTAEAYIEAYSEIIAIPKDGDFSTKGYAPSFVTDWLAQQQKLGNINADANGYISFTSDAENQLIKSLIAIQ